jgi:hypothetical protein
MLIPIVRTRQNGAALVPDYLLWIREADTEEAIQHLACEDGSMPDIGNLQVLYQLEGLGPVGARVSGDCRLGVTLGPVLHVAGLGWSAAVEASATPF